MNKRTKHRRAGRIAGALIGVLLAILICAALVRGFGALMMGGLSMISEAGNMPVGDVAAPSAQPTMPPLAEETAPPDEEEALTDPVEVPVLQTPEQLAETAVDLTPPPDAPIG